MPLVKFIALLLLLNTPVLARDFPMSIVQTKEDFFLKGNPKIAFTQSSKSDAISIVEDKFNQDGILISHMVGGTQPSTPFETEIKKGRFIETRYSPSNIGTAPTSRAVQYDTQGRVTALKDMSHQIDGYYAKAAPKMDYMLGAEDTIVRIVRYEPNRQTHDIYKNRSLVQSITFDFSTDNKLIRTQCVAGDCANFINSTFSNDGVLSSNSSLSEINYYYHDGLLASVATVSKRTGLKEVVYYGDYTFDQCNNWTQQATFDQPPTNLLRERTSITLRKLEYFTPCATNDSPAPSQLTCPSILTYRIGNIDPRFGLSKETLIKAAAGAANLWNTQAGRPLLQYKEDGDIPIHLVYDQRQTAIDNLQNDLKTNQTLQNPELKAEYSTLISNLNTKNTAFQNRRERYEQAIQEINITGSLFAKDLENYNNSVTLRNTQPKLSSQSITDINNAKIDLETRQKLLQNKQNELLQEREYLEQERLTLTTLISQAKTLEDSLNLQQVQIVKNTKNKYIAKEFHVGLYRAEGAKRWIDIYSFLPDNLLTDLKLTLAHEFGHALGFRHVEDSSAVMYFKTGSNTFQLSLSDIALLAKQCPMP